VDVGASAQIRQALVDLRDAGVAVLVVSEELDELFEICDRICVMARGRLSPGRPARETNAEDIGLLMAGSFIGTRREPRERESAFVDTRPGESP
jgi:simple sugar transport system ATP-binding protein